MTLTRGGTVVPFPNAASRKAEADGPDDHLDHLDHLRELYSLCVRRCASPATITSSLSLYFGLQLRQSKTEAALSWIEQQHPSARDVVRNLRTSLSKLSEAAARGLHENYPEDIMPELKNFLASIEML